MSDFGRDFARFSIRVRMRRASLWALWGLAASLALIAAAPWLALDFVVLIALPALLPLAFAATALATGPGRREAAILADFWTQGQGSITAALELAPDNPFLPRVQERALHSLRAGRIPAPGALRYALTCVLVLAALLPLSRHAHATWAGQNGPVVKSDRDLKPEIEPGHAAVIARSAARAAEAAKSLHAPGPESLADAVEDAARRAQAGADDKERALRNANSLVDRARRQTRDQQARELVREQLAAGEATRAIADAAKSPDPAALDKAANDAAKSLFNGANVDRSHAAELRDALQKAAAAAPHDAQLKQAAADAMKELSPEKLAAAEAALARKHEELKSRGAADEVIAREMEQAGQQAGAGLRESLKALGQAAHLMKDLDPEGKLAKDVLERMMREGGGDRLAEMAEQARKMSSQLQFDAETLREMLKHGRNFPGLEEHARQLMEKSLKDGKPMDPSGLPRWGQDALPEEMRKAAAHNRAKNADTGSGRKRTGVDVETRRDGPVDPEGKTIRHDPSKAPDETSRLNPTGTRTVGGSAEPVDDLDRLPRRYRDAARKYFDR